MLILQRLFIKLDSLGSFLGSSFLVSFFRGLPLVPHASVFPVDGLSSFRFSLLVDILSVPTPFRFSNLPLPLCSRLSLFICLFRHISSSLDPPFVIQSLALLLSVCRFEHLFRADVLRMREKVIVRNNDTAAWNIFNAQVDVGVIDELA